MCREFATSAISNLRPIPKAFGAALSAGPTKISYVLGLCLARLQRPILHRLDDGLGPVAGPAPRLACILHHVTRIRCEASEVFVTKKTCLGSVHRAITTAPIPTGVRYENNIAHQFRGFVLPALLMAAIIGIAQAE